MSIQRVKKKIIISGNIIEVYEYENGYLKGYTNDSKSSGSSEMTESFETDEEIRDRSLSRSKKQVRRIINSNVGQYGEKFTSKFLTLSFGENIQDIQMANYEFKKFIKRLNYKIYNTKKAKIKYLVVPEFQQRGAIHYHVILFNIPYVKQSILQDVWENGIVDIRKIDEVDNVGSYIAEYLGKEEKNQGKSKNDERLKGQKTYFCSRGIYRPVELTEKKAIDSILVDLSPKNLTYTASFENDYTGSIRYSQYNINKLNNQLRGGDTKK
jgi:hypothetical protein